MGLLARDVNAYEGGAALEHEKIEGPIDHKAEAAEITGWVPKPAPPNHPAVIPPHHIISLLKTDIAYITFRL